jgi:hypothetical protein
MIGDDARFLVLIADRTHRALAQGAGILDGEMDAVRRHHSP